MLVFPRKANIYLKVELDNVTVYLFSGLSSIAAVVDNFRGR